MRGIWRTTWFRLVLAVAAVLVVGALGACWHYRVWSYRDYIAYSAVRRCPGGEDLWHGRVLAGDDLAAFTAAYRPHLSRQVGPYTVLSYYPGGPPQRGISLEGLTLTARDGRLLAASAGGCTWGREFFAMSQEEQAAFEEAYDRALAAEGPEPSQ
jgi:hypothetical protein